MNNRKNGNLKTLQRAITEFRTLLLQDYLRMEIAKEYADDSWKDILYSFYKTGLECDHPEQYAAPFTVMQRKGMEQYCVADMDTTILISVLGFSQLTETLHIGAETVEILKLLQQERNTVSHSSENETAEDLYNEEVKSLDHLKAFIETTCAESTLPAEKLEAYKQKYIQHYLELRDGLKPALQADTQESNLLHPHNSWTRMFLRKPCDCPACRDFGSMVLNQKRNMYLCMTCGFTMTKKERMKEILWFCDGCDTFLNMQTGFKEHGKTWICTVCGYDNDVSDQNIF